VQTRRFPTELLLHKPERSRQLIQRFYELHHDRDRDRAEVMDEEKKLRFFADQIGARGIDVGLGLDIGCRGGTLTKKLCRFGQWVGVDIDRKAVDMANRNGVPCAEMDVATAIDFRDQSFDAVCATDVIEHLPYPTVTLHEIHRILKKAPTSFFVGAVPIDYDLHRRFAVFRGKRLTYDPTHLRSFSFREVKDLLDYYFEEVVLEPIRGTARRHRWLSWDLFVRKLAWFARSPRPGIDSSGAAPLPRELRRAG